MENVIIEKSYRFAERILNIYFYLRSKKHYRLAEQIVGPGTSIGANVREAQAAHSKIDFISKMTIASKEARETEYWLNLFNREELLKSHPDLQNSLAEIKEIIKILNAILISSKKNIK
jgi:four helix bundle protein